MPKLHLVAITPDNKGLVLSEQAESNRGDLVLDIDDRLLDAIDRAQRQRARDEGQKLSSAALPTRREMPDGAGGERPSPRQIQERLRAGETVAAIAKSAGIDETWVERFAPPVLAELERVAVEARRLTFSKPRVGPSRTPLGASVAANVVDRGVEMSDEEMEAAWSAYQRPGSWWMVTFSLPVKGRRQKAEWSVDLTTGELVARNKLATELGFRESPSRAAARPAAARQSGKPAGAKSEPAKGARAKSEPAKGAGVKSEPAKAAGARSEAATAEADKAEQDEGPESARAAEAAAGPEGPATVQVTEPEAVVAASVRAAEGARDGVQTLPGTVPDPDTELEQVLDSAGIAPAPPAPRAGEADPTMEVGLPARPGPATPRPRPEPPSTSPS